MISKNTQLRLLVDGKESINGWSAKSLPAENDQTEKKKNSISLQIDSPSNAIIGKYAVILYEIFIFIDDLFIYFSYCLKFVLEKVMKKIYLINQILHYFYLKWIFIIYLIHG